MFANRRAVPKIKSRNLTRGKQIFRLLPPLYGKRRQNIFLFAMEKTVSYKALPFRFTAPAAHIDDLAHLVRSLP